MKSSISVNGRQYISASRAAEITKYSRDYIGQLCRSGKVPSTMVLRSWFVDLDALIEYREVTEKHLRAYSQNSIAGSATHISIEKKAVIIAEPTKKSIPVPKAPEASYSYSSDERALLPDLKKAAPAYVIPAKPVAIPQFQPVLPRQQDPVIPRKPSRNSPHEAVSSKTHSLAFAALFLFISASLASGAYPNETWNTASSVAGAIGRAVGGVGHQLASVSDSMFSNTGTDNKMSAVQTAAAGDASSNPAEASIGSWWSSASRSVAVAVRKFLGVEDDKNSGTNVFVTNTNPATSSVVYVYRGSMGTSIPTDASSQTSVVYVPASTGISDGRITALENSVYYLGYQISQFQDSQTDNRELITQIVGQSISNAFRGFIGGGTTIINNTGGGGSGSVTSVDVSGGTTGISFSGGPVTTSGTLTMSGVLGVANGGTALASAPTYGQVLVGDNAGGYALMATSSLGLGGSSGTVSSVDASGGTTGLTFTGGPVTTSGTLTLGGRLGVANGGTGWSAVAPGAVLYGNGAGALSTTTPATAGQVLAFLNGVPTWTATTTAGTGLTYSGGSFNVNPSQSISQLSNLSTDGIVRTSGGNGTLIVDTNAYLVGNQNITLTGDITGSGTTSIVTAYNNVVPINKGGTGLSAIGASSTLLTSNGTSLVYQKLSPDLFTSTNVSQWTNDAGYITSLAGAASSTLLADNNTFTGTNAFGNISVVNLTASGILTVSGVGTSTFTNGITAASLALSGAPAGCAQFGPGGFLTSTGVDCGAGGTSFAYPFGLPGNATSTLTQFNGGLTAYASSTIGDGTETGGLTVNGGATTTGNAYIAGNLGIGTTSPSQKFSVQGNGLFSGNISLANLTATGTISAATLNLTNALTIGNGGTGLNTIGASSTLLTSNGTSLVYQKLSPDLFTSTNVSQWTNDAGYVTAANVSAYPFGLPGNATSTLTQFNGGLTAYASSTIGNGTQAGGLTINGGATTTGNAYFAGNVGIGINASDRTLDVGGTGRFSGLVEITPTTGVSLKLGTNTDGSVSSPVSIDLGGTYSDTAGQNPKISLYKAGGLNLGFGFSANEFDYIANTAGTHMFWSGTTRDARIYSDGVRLPSASEYSFTSDTNLTTPDSGIGRLSAGVVRVTNGSSGDGNLYVGGTGNNYFGGNVGFGTVSPNAQVSLGANLSNSKLLVYDSGGTSIGLGVQSGEFRFHVNSSATDFNFYNAPAGDQLFSIKGTGLVGIGTTSPYRQLSVGNSAVFGGNVTAASFTSTSTATSTFAGGIDAARICITGTTTCLGVGGGTFASTTLLADNNTFTGVNSFTYASTTALTVSGSFYGAGLVNCTTGNKLTWADGQFICAIDATGGGTGGGSWSTTTSQVAGQNINYSNNSTDIVAVGGLSTTTSSFFFDPNTQIGYVAGRLGIGTTSPSQKFSVQGNGLFSGNISLANLTATGTISAATLNLTNALTIGNGGTGLSAIGASSTLLTSNGTSLVYQKLSPDLFTSTNVSQWTNDAGYITSTFAFPFTPVSYGNATSTTLGFLNGFLSTASSTINAPLRLSTLSQGVLNVGLGGLLYSSATSTATDFAYPFGLAGNATSTRTQFNGGLTAYASSTIGNGTRAGGLTVSGGATTTGKAYFADSVLIGGSVNPNVKLEVVGTGGASTRLVSEGGWTTQYIENYSTSYWASIAFKKGGGTMAAPTYPVTDTFLGEITFSNKDDVGGALIRAQATQNHSVSAAGGKIIFGTTPDNATQSLERMVIQSSGNVGIGTTSPYRQLSVGNSAVFGGNVTAASFTSTSTATSTFAGGIDAARICITGTTTCLANMTNGTVTSIDASGGTTGLTFTGGPITSSGVLTLNGTLTIGNGGTGLSAIGASSTLLTSNGTSLVYQKLSPDLFTSTNVSQWTNDAGYITSLAGAASSTLLADNNTFTGSNRFGNLTATGTVTFASLTGSTQCLRVDTNGVLSGTGADCGAGGSLSTWATTTSQVAGQNVNAPLSSSDIVTVGSNSTTTAEFFFDPNTQTAYIAGRLGIGTNAPTEALDVAGSVNISSGQAYTYNGIDLAFGVTSLSDYFFGGAGNLGMSGSDNIGIGLNVLRLTDAGDKNIGIGTNALSTNDSGSSNLALGFQALLNNNNGSGNIALGEDALTSNVSGSNNTVVGYLAGNDVTGSNNLLLGASTGQNLTTGSNNIAIGYNVNTPAAGSSNTLNVGNLLFGTGIDGTGSTLSSGNLGIGTTSPSQKFSVQGNGLFSGNISLANLTATGTISAATLNLTNALTIGNGGTGLNTIGASSTLLTSNGTSLVYQKLSPDLFTSTNVSQWTNDAGYITSLAGAASSTLLADNNTFTGTNVFNGIQSYASSTIGNGTQAGGLTISGGATTTGNLAVQGTATSTFASNLAVAGRLSVQQDGTNAVIIGNTLGNARGLFALDIQNYRSANEQIASGDYSIAVGASNYAIGGSSVTIGGGNTASGTSAVAFGNANIASGYRSISFGRSNIASGDNANAVGRANIASGNTSSAFGYMNTASGINSSAFGNSVVTSATGASAFGSYITNTIASSTQIGPSDAAKITILSSGNVGIGTTSPYRQLSVGNSAVFGGNVTAASFTSTSTATSTFAGGIDAARICITGTTTCLANMTNGTVTSIDASGGTTGLTFTGGPITSSGVLTLNGTLTIGNGGTGLSAIGASSTLLTSNGTSLVYQKLSPDLFTSTNVSQWTNDAGYITSTFAFPFTPVSYGNATSTTLGFLNGFLSTASSTINAPLRLSTLSQGVLNVGLGGLLYSSATSTATDFAYPFGLAGNATSTRTQFNGGLTAYASSTIGNGTRAGGLTVSGGATTTGNAYFAGNVGIGSTTPFSKLALSGGNFTHVAAGNPTFRGQYNTSGIAHDVFISGKYAYIADDTAGLRIVDISNNSSPTLLGTYNTTGQAYGVTVSGKYAYVSDGTSGLQIIDVSNSSLPTLVSTYNTSGDAGRTYVSGKYAYVADEASGLQIIDVSNPISPRLVGTADTSGEAYDVYVSGRYAYVADVASGLQIIDVSNPAAPVIVGTYDTPDFAFGVYVSGRYAYVADSSSGLQIINIANPAAPTLVGTYDTVGSAVLVTVSGKYAYVADATNGTVIIDVSVPASPQYVGSFNTSSGTNGPHSTFVSGKYAYVADSDAGLVVLDINGIETPSLYAGNIETNVLNSSENINAGGDIYAGGGLNVGISGIFSRGSLGVFVASTTAINPISATFMGGNVGIGTTSPYRQLSVGNSAVFGDNVTAASFTSTSTATSTFAGGIDAARICITGTTTCLGVGGGTFASTTLLADNNTFTGTNVFNGIQSYASSTIGDGTQAGGLTVSGGATTTGKAYFADSVLIGGSVNPNVKLEVVGAAGASTRLVSEAGWTTQYIENYSTSYWASIAFKKGGGTMAAPTYPSLNNILGEITFNNKDAVGGASIVALATQNHTVSAAGGKITFGTTPDNATQSLERMVIQSSGNVGIGTTSPYRQLSVGNSAVFGDNVTAASFTSTSTATSTFAGGIDAARICITGTTTCLGVGGGTFASTTLLADNNTFTGTNVFNGIQSYASSTIGDGTETGGLTVNGGATTTGNAYIAGNLGIGTTSPSQKFSVQGNGLFSGNISLANLTATGTISAATLNLTNALTIGNGGTGLNTIGASSTLLTSNGTSLVYQKLSPDLFTSTNVSQWTNDAGYITSLAGAASSTLLADNNTFSGTNVFNGIQSYASSTIGNGTQAGGLTISGGATTTGNLAVQGTATSTFAGGIDAARICITGTATCLGVGGGTFASTTLLADNNTFSGINVFNGIQSYASSTIGNGTQAGGLTINGGATTTGISTVGGLNISSITGSNQCLTINPFGQVAGTGSACASAPTGTTGQVAYFNGTNNVAGTSALFISPAGNVGVGTVSPNFSLQVSSSSAYLDLNDTDAPTNAKHILLSNIDGIFRIGTSSDDFTATSTGFQFNPAGEAAIGIGTTSPWRTLSVAGSAAITGLTSSTAGNAVCILPTGELVTSANTTCITSALSTKSDIVSITSEQALGILDLVPAEYTNKERGDRRYGFIADWTDGIDKKLVEYGSTTSPTTPTGFDYLRYPALLTKFVQDMWHTMSRMASAFDTTSAPTTTPSITIDAAGNLSIGTGTSTNALYKLQVQGDIAATSFVNISTRAAKKDISYLTDADKSDVMSKIRKISIAEYRYQDESGSNPLRLGLIAEEAPAEVLSVGGKGVDIYKLATFILAGVQEQDRKITDMDARMAILEARFGLAEGQRSTIVGSSTLGVSTTTASTTISIVSSWLQSAGMTIENTMARFTSLFADSLTANSVSTKSLKVASDNVLGSGITITDRVTGKPVCMFVANGTMQSEPGECGASLVPVTPPVIGNNGGGTGTSTATTTPPVTPPPAATSTLPVTPPPTATSTPSVTATSTAPTTPPVSAPAPTPEPVTPVAPESSTSPTTPPAESTPPPSSEPAPVAAAAPAPTSTP